MSEMFTNQHRLIVLAVTSSLVVVWLYKCIPPNLFSRLESKPSDGRRRSLPTCNPDQIQINDTDVENVIEPCRFPVISQDPVLEENINSLLSIHLPLLANYKNPCWYEHLVSSWRSEYDTQRQMFPYQSVLSFAQMIPILKRRESRLENPWRLRCLPLVYIVGVAKSGTSDLFATLSSHPHVTAGATKEPFFWDRLRWRRMRFVDYLALYDEAAERIRQFSVPASRRGKPVAYHPMVTMDASVNTLVDFGGVRFDSRTREPGHIAADLIQNLTPRSDIKVIAIVRNPTERLFSSYVFFNTVTHPSKISAREFHSIAYHLVDRLKACFRSRTLRSCLYDKLVTQASRNVNVNAGIYYPYIKDWMKAFPSMKIVRTEDYRQNRSLIYEQLVDYIGLDAAGSELAKSSTIAGRGPKRDFEMLNETKQLLDDFYKPFNEMLADLLGNKKYLFID